jgi:hypothetical protein
MSIIYRRQGVCLAAAIILCLPAARGQSVTPLGGEFSILGSLPGDQVWPALSLSPTAGIVVWEDNMIDGQGAGVGGAVLDHNLNAQPVFKVNKVATGNQIKPQVQLLRNGNTIFVWESSVAGSPDIYARFAKGTNFYTADIIVNTCTTDQQVDPVVAALPDGGAIVAWSSYGQDGSQWGVYARKLTAAGKGATPREFLVNQYTAYNQQNPAVATLANGNVAIAWVSEHQRFAKSKDIYARVFTSAGVPVTDEILVNSGTNLCANPALAPLNSGGFTVAWSQQDAVVYTNGWDVWGRAFAASGTPTARDFRINSFLYGDQYRPKIASGPNGCLVVWTSLGQDGDHEGVFGRYLLGGNKVSGSEFQVNTTWINRQFHPAVAWNGADRFLVVWTSFSGVSGFDLFGQMYVLNPNP